MTNKENHGYDLILKFESFLIKVKLIPRHEKHARLFYIKCPWQNVARDLARRVKR